MRPYGRQPLVSSLVSVPASGVVSFQWAATALQAPSARVAPPPDVLVHIEPSRDT